MILLLSPCGASLLSMALDLAMGAGLDQESMFLFKMRELSHLIQEAFLPLHVERGLSASTCGKKRFCL